MNTDENYIICLLDVLGFENLFNKIGLDEIEIRYKKLIEVVEQNNIQVAITVINGVPAVGNPDIKSAYFSDTILFWCRYNKFTLDILLDVMKEVMCKSIEIGLPLRGAVSVGKAIIDKEKSIFLGMPFINAARAETSQKWIGITLSKDFDLKEYNKGFKADNILEYTKHIKQDCSSKVISFVIDYPRQWRKTRQSSLNEAINTLNTDSNYDEYYKNSIDFVSFSEQNSEWWTKLPSYIAELEKRKNINVH